MNNERTLSKETLDTIEDLLLEKVKETRNGDRRSFAKYDKALSEFRKVYRNW
jgi:hypothetical protein